MSSISASASPVRPVAITVAIVLLVLSSLGNLATLVIPVGNDGIPTFIVVLSVVLGIAGLLAAVGLWRLMRWGMVLTVVVSALSALSSALGTFGAPGIGLRVVNAIGVIVGIVTIWLVVRSASRPLYR